MQARALTLNMYFAPFEFDSDPQTMLDARSMQINLQIHRGLFRFLPDGELRGDLASSWKLSSDNLKLTVTLKKATFSDGTSVNANHVVYTFARLFFVGSSMAADLSAIKGGDRVKASHHLKDFGVRRVDDQTVEFELNRPNGILLKQLAAVDCAILEIPNVESVFEGPKWRPKVGAGPYKVLNESPSEIILTKWRSDLLDSKYAPTEVRIALTSEIKYQTLIEHYKTDSLDQLVVTKQESQDLQRNKWHQVVTDMTREHFVILNPTKLSAELRRTLVNHIDSEKIASAMGSGFEPAHGFVPPVLSGSLTKLSGAVKSPIDAKRKIEVLIPNVWEHRKLIEAALKESWRGFDVHFVEVAPSEWNRAKVAKNYDALINARGIDYPDGISILNYFRSGVEGNFYFISDQAVDKMLDSAASEINDLERADIYRKIQTRVLEKNIVVPLFFGSQASGLWSERVSFVPAHPLGYHFLPFEMLEMRQ